MIKIRKIQITIPLEILFWGANIGDILKSSRIDLSSREKFLLNVQTLDGPSLGLLGPERILRSFTLFSRADKTTLDKIQSCLNNLTIGTQTNLSELSFRTRNLVGAWDDKRALVSGLGQRAEYFRKEPSRL